MVEVGGTSEERLPADALRGDEAAFELLVERHRGELLAHCYRMLGSVQDAEDAVQESLLGAWRGLVGFEGRSSLRSRLFRVPRDGRRGDQLAGGKVALADGRAAQAGGQHHFGGEAGGEQPGVHLVVGRLARVEPGEPVEDPAAPPRRRPDRRTAQEGARESTDRAGVRGDPP